MNEKNLIPFEQRTESEQREIRKKGGVKSGETRRLNRDLKKLAKRFLNADTGREDLRAALRENGFDDDISNAAALVLQIASEAFSGNMRAAELLIKLSGNDPDQKRKDAELKIKQEDLKLKRDFIKQQTIKLKRFNFGDDEDNDWIIGYDPDNNAFEPFRQIALMEVEEAIKDGKDLEALENHFGSMLEQYVTRRIADYLIKKKQEYLKEERE